MPSEGGGSSAGGLLGGVSGFVKLFTGGQKKNPPFTVAEKLGAKLLSGGRRLPAQAPRPARSSLDPARRNVIYSQQPGTPQPPAPQQQPSGPVYDAIQTGISLVELLQLIISLFRKPESYATGTYTEVGQVPYLMAPTGGLAGYEGGSTLAGIGSLAGGIGSIISAIRGVPQVMPGGASGFVAPAAGAMARVLGGVATGAAGAGIIDWLTGPEACGAMSQPFAAGGGGRRARMFVVPNPDTGKPTWFRPAGAPVLWTGDLSAAKKVRRVARLARRRSGGR